MTARVQPRSTRPTTWAQQQLLEHLRDGHTFKRTPRGTWQQFYPNGLERDFPPSNATVRGLIRRGLVQVNILDELMLTAAPSRPLDLNTCTAADLLARGSAEDFAALDLPPEWGEPR